jgi:hypothetical protein
VWWGVILDAVLAAAAILAIYLVSRRGKISAKHFHQPQPTAFVRPKRRKKKSRSRR